MNVKLLTEHHLEFLSLKGGCTGLSESTLVKMPHCWKSHVTAYFTSPGMNISTPRFLIARDISPCLGSIDKNNLKKKKLTVYTLVILNI